MENTTTSSSARDVKSNLKRRKQLDVLAYCLPVEPNQAPAPTSVPEIRICDQYGDLSLDSTILPLARALILLDDEMIKRVQRFYQKRNLSVDEARRTKMVPLVNDCIEIKRQWKEINSGKCEFTHLYMRRKWLIPIWAESLRIIKEALAGNQTSNRSQKQTHYEQILHRCDTLANDVKDHMLDIAREGLLDPEVLSSIQGRWLRLDGILNWYYDLHKREADEPEQRWLRISPTWREMQSLIQHHEAMTKGEKEQIQTQPAGNARDGSKPAAAVSLVENQRFSAFILWSSFFTCAAISTASFAIGYGRSLHLPGNADDPDFWFLIQASCVQVLGLTVSALIERRRGSLSSWRWCLPTAIAGACAIGSIPLYVFVPKEWSTFLSTITGATQTFMALQYFLL
ncbi:hypothetical protein DPSP01_002169 [Paraphaeosphaeria sporulosa]|uniref:Uncharacterized protein n=1 Tax=Paraphaeosphaeria sporulosa TaxID=1460663 RepID=A0A177BZ88_9PLEO|nr:uncharacterized protein CC84DRAFT_322023 [Paraphaeosphaeria sporulosa]OAG00703.1 hypothetical protein CC84DRAFT_322023 [Paraphaeosphaeria sporulosa]